MSEPCNAIIRIRIPESDRAALATAAGGRGKLSEWMRRLAYDAAGLPSAGAVRPPGPRPGRKGSRGKPLIEIL